MSSATLTKEQSAAIVRRDVPIGLSAGAGCGKTHVLTLRFLSHLDPTADVAPVELHQLIAITFTDAAAREQARYPQVIERAQAAGEHREQGFADAVGGRAGCKAWRRFDRPPAPGACDDPHLRVLRNSARSPPASA